MDENKEFEMSATEAANKKDSKLSFFKSRGFKYGTLATALTAVLIIVVIAANMVLSILSDKFAWSFDLTSTDLYAVSDATKQVVNSLDKNAEIKVTVFSAESEYPYYLSEPVKRFCNLSDKISYSYVDLEKNPTAATKYGTEYNITTYSVVVECGDRIRVFNAEDYYSYDQESGAISIFLQEKLAAGALYVTKEDIPVVYFIGGHGEDGYKSLMNLVANNGADVQEINLSTHGDNFSPYAKLMVICNPLRDYSDTEIRMIEDFLNNGNKFGRNIMIFSSAEAYSLPNLEKLIAQWGIAMNKDIVYDDKSSYTGFPNMVIPEFTTEEIMSTGQTVNAVVSPLVTDSRSLTLLFEEDELFKTQSLIISKADSSYSRDAATVTNEVGKQPTDKDGPHILSALSMKHKFENNIQTQSYMFVSGSANLIEDQHLQYFNGEFIMQIYKIMVNEQDDTIVSAQKSKASAVATITAPQMQTVAIIILAVIPAIFLIFGLALYIRRRFL